MSREQMGGFEDNKVALGNQMQTELAVEHGEPLDSFIMNHAQDFREIIDSNPKLLDEFVEKPDETLEKVGKRMFH